MSDARELLASEISIAGHLRIENGRLLSPEEKQRVVTALRAAPAHLERETLIALSEACPEPRDPSAYLSPFHKDVLKVARNARAILALSPAPDRGAVEPDKLPCDVHLPPNTYIRKGCGYSTLLLAIRQREKYPDADTQFVPPVAPFPSTLNSWRPVNTSPTDGTPFIGYLGGLNVPYFVCWWSTSVKTGEPYICILGVGELYDHKLFPTHWMPLPAPPAAKET